jgi:monofunctional biosynthetic peptidoglycan transglycosylase
MDAGARDLTLCGVERRGERVAGRGTSGGLLRTAIRLILALVLGNLALVLVLGLAYRVVTPVSTLMLGRWLTLQPVARDAVPLDAVGPALPLAVLASEDARFCRHGGVDWDALRTVLDEADEDGPSRGASTIAMQTAKNLFLWPSRSYVRKGMEIPIALYLGVVWPKRRIMEVYLNIAEWGEGVFGAEAAARRYFGKRARDLSRREAALLATALPNPILRNPARPWRRHQALAQRLVGRMEGAAPFADCLQR